MAQVKISGIWAMLKECAPGYTTKEKKHHWWVTWNGKTFQRLPLGEHGSRKDPEIQLGKVRGLVTQLEIPRDCVAKHFPELADKNADAGQPPDDEDGEA